MSLGHARNWSFAEARAALLRLFPKKVDQWAVCNYELGNDDLVRFAQLATQADPLSILLSIRGAELLQSKVMRAWILEFCSDAKLHSLVKLRGREPWKQRKRNRDFVEEFNWTRGGTFARQFVAAFGFPEAFAGHRNADAKRSVERIAERYQLPVLHDFQERCLNDLEKLIASKAARRRGMLTLPTGSGKTLVMVETLRRHVNQSTNSLRAAILWIVESEELCEQAIECFQNIWEGNIARPYELYRLFDRHDHCTPPDLPQTIIVATIDKLHSLLNGSEEESQWGAWLKAHLTALVIDEAHHAVAPTYTKVLNTLGIVTAKKNSRDPFALIGLTATPGRSSDDETRRLSNRFDGRLVTPFGAKGDALDVLRARGILSRPTHESVQTDYEVELTPDEERFLSQMHTLKPTLLNRIGSDPARNQKIWLRLLDLKPGTPTLVFACSVKHAEYLVALLTIAGRSAGFVCGETPKPIRRELIEEFREGRLDFLVNFGVLTTGFDAPNIEVIAIARPTSSPVLYEQMIGRGMRGPANKGTETCTIIDFVDNFHHFDGQMAFRRFEHLWTKVVKSAAPVTQSKARAVRNSRVAPDEASSMFDIFSEPNE